MSDEDTPATVKCLRVLAVIPRVCAVALMGLLLAAMSVVLYSFAYLLVPVGLSIMVIGIVGLSPRIAILGLLLAGFGGSVYIEWFDDGPSSLPTLSELAIRILKL